MLPQTPNDSDQNNPDQPDDWHRHQAAITGEDNKRTVVGISHCTIQLRDPVKEPWVFEHDGPAVILIEEGWVCVHLESRADHSNQQGSPKIRLERISDPDKRPNGCEESQDFDVTDVPAQSTFIMGPGDAIEADLQLLITLLNIGGEEGARMVVSDTWDAPAHKIGGRCGGGCWGR